MMGTQERRLGARQEGFFSVALATLCTDALLEFDLYLPTAPSRAAVLYRERHLPFTNDARKRLVDHAISRLLVPKEQAEAYHAYLEANLSAILANPRVPVEEKAGVLKTSAINIMKGVLSDPRAGVAFDRSQRLAQTGITFIFSEPRALQNLVRLTSYDYYTYTHSVNVFLFSMALAKNLGYQQRDVLAFGHGALLHDIGKCLIDPAILNHPGKLNEDQWREIKRHPINGYNILRKQGISAPETLDVARHHHERITGKGYPDGLAGDQIPVFTRIACVVDVFDALTTRRPYRDALDPAKAIALMNDQMGKDFDPGVFRVFVRMMHQRQVA